jgi:hypothetical protein
MSIEEFCSANHITVWSARRLSDTPRWRIVIQWTDGSRHQMTLTVRSTERPDAAKVMRSLIQEAQRFEEDPAANLLHWDLQRKLLRFLGDDLYQQALQCKG